MPPQRGNRRIRIGSDATSRLEDLWRAVGEYANGSPVECRECPHDEAPGVAYFEAIVSGVEGEKQGTRNTRLNGGAWAIARWANAANLDENEWCEQLIEAGGTSGLTPQEIRGTVQSGWRAGVANPHRLEVLPDFPTHLLPSVMRDLVASESTRLRIPQGMTALPALVTAAAAIGGSASVRTDDREHPSRLWGLIVANSGAGKSPGLEVALRPYREFATLRDRDRVAAFDALDRWTHSKAEEKGGKPAIPSPLRVTDTTTEALWEALQDAPRGILLDADELSAWAGGLDAYRASQRAGPDRHRYCSLWTQTSEAIHRKQQRPIIVERPILSLIGGMHPSGLKALNSNPDGLAQRFLYTYHQGFEEPYPSRDLPDQDVLSRWKGVVIALLLNHSTRVLEMSPVALRAWQDGRDRRIDAQRKHGAPALYRKMDALSATLALVLTLVDNPKASQVKSAWVKVAWDLCLDYFAPHGRKALAGTDTPQAEVRGIAWLRKHGQATLRELVKNNVGGVKNAEEARVLVAEWEQRDLVTVQVKRIAGGPQTIIEIRS